MSGSCRRAWHYGAGSIQGPRLCTLGTCSSCLYFSLPAVRVLPGHLSSVCLWRL